MPINTFRDLRIWQEAHALTLTIYTVTTRFPVDERYLLVNQLRRSAASVGANIAEGLGRRSAPEFRRFLRIASGSLQETLQHCLLAADLGYIPEAQAKEIETRYTGLSAGIQAYVSKLSWPQSTHFTQSTQSTQITQSTPPS